MTELDLSNPAVIESLKAKDVLARKPNDIEQEKIEAEIASLDVPNDFTIKLSKLQVQQLQREAGQLGLSVETHLNNRVQSELFAKNIGAPLIGAPSVLSGKAAMKVTGPSWQKK